MMITGAVAAGYHAGRMASLPRGSLGSMDVEVHELFLYTIMGVGTAIYGGIIYCFDSQMDDPPATVKANKALDEMDIKVKGQ
jgi:hypothetical protein